jgi:hypothetical protein
MNYLRHHYQNVSTVDYNQLYYFYFVININYKICLTPQFGAPLNVLYYPHVTTTILYYPYVTTTILYYPYVTITILYYPYVTTTGI